MDIHIGKGGNQKLILKGDSIPPYQGYVTKDEDGDLIFMLRNITPVYFDGERAAYIETLVDPESKMSWVNTDGFDMAALLEPMDLDELSDWGVAMRRFDSLEAAEVFSRISIGEYTDEDGCVDTTAYSNAICCLAYYQIEKGLFRKAQENIYEAADDLFGEQDGSVKLKRAYTAVLGLAAYFYFKIGRHDLAKSTLADFNKIVASGIKCSDEVMKVVENIK